MLKGKAPLTVVRTASQGYVHVYAGGVAPGDILADDAERLVREGYLEQVEEPATAGTETSASSGGKAPKVNDILAEVGTDKEKAAAALETEKARGDDARSTLLEKLQAVLDAD